MSDVTESAEPASGQRRWRVPSVGMMFISALVLVIVGVGLTVVVPLRQKLRLLDHIENSDSLTRVTTEYRGPPGLAERLGDGDRDVFTVITQLTLWGADRKTLSLATAQPALRKLSLFEGQISPELLAQFSTHLTDLELLLANIDDEELIGLQRHVGLERLRLVSCAKIDGTGFVHLRDLSHLEMLDLSFCPITDEGLWHIAWLSGLEDLDLRGTFMTDVGVRHLERLPNLTHLNVSGTAVGDEGIEALARIPKLAELKASPDQFSDAGRAQLKLLRPEITLSTE